MKMGESQNSLPVDTYVRSRLSTVVRDVAGLSSGSITLDLAKPSDVTLIIVSDPMEGMPSYFVAAVGRTPTLMDFDILVCPLDSELVKPQGRVTLHLPAMNSVLNWASFGPEGISQGFGSGSIGRLIVAIDQ
jgi:hypothetical protein